MNMNNVNTICVRDDVMTAESLTFDLSRIAAPLFRDDCYFLARLRHSLVEYSVTMRLRLVRESRVYVITTCWHAHAVAVNVEPLVRAPWYFVVDR